MTTQAVAQGSPRTSTPWAQIPAPFEAVRLPAERQPFNLLELFLYGGLSPWESFYVVPEYGDPANNPKPYRIEHGIELGKTYTGGSQWWTFQSGVARTIGSEFARCGGADRPLLAPWRTDALGKTVNLGPFIAPLRERPDLLARMRVWTMRHDVFDHVGAVPFSLTGLRRGSSRGAALGTHLERFFRDRVPVEVIQPFSYTLYQRAADLVTNTDAAAAIGLHRAASRPLSLRLGPQSREFLQRLERRVIGDRHAQVDALAAAYLADYRQRLGADMRAPALADLEHGHTSVEGFRLLQQIFAGADLTPSDAQTCEKEPSPDDTAASIALGVKLANHPLHPARYVCVIEGGLYPDRLGAGYDTHFDHVRWTASNTLHSMKHLVSRINEPGERDPTKIDLDRTMVLLNTEFGRSPYPQRMGPDGELENWGTDHWPYGYVVVGLGGPIDEERSGIVGALDENAIASSGSISPTQHRAAMLLMMGAWPFTPESFAVGDLPDIGTEVEGAAWLREMVLGYPL